MDSNYAAPGQIGRNQEILGQDEFNTLSTESFVCWSAVIAGALAAASLSLILLILGMGLGLSTVSPWVHAGATAGAIGLSAILWITVSQVLASAAAGYIAGRARFQWNGIHSDEIYFRDTVHGFLAWAVSTLLTAALLTTLIGSILGTSVQAGAALTGGAAAVTAKLGSNSIDGGSSTQSNVSYAVDSLFRKDMAATALDTSTINITNPVNADVSKTDTTKNSSNEESMRIFIKKNRLESI